MTQRIRVDGLKQTAYLYRLLQYSKERTYIERTVILAVKMECVLANYFNSCAFIFNISDSKMKSLSLFRDNKIYTHRIF